MIKTHWLNLCRPLQRYLTMERSEIDFKVYLGQGHQNDRLYYIRKLLLQGQQYLLLFKYLGHNKFLLERMFYTIPHSNRKDIEHSALFFKKGS